MSATRTPAGRSGSVDRLPVAGAATALRMLWRTVPGRWWRVPGLVVVLVAAAAAGVVGPLALGAVVDALAAGGGAAAGGDAVPARADLTLVWTVGGVMVGAVVVGAVLDAIGTVAASRLLETGLADLRESMVEAAFRLPAARIERAGTGDLSARAGDDVAEVSDAIPRVLPALVGALFTILVTVAGMAVIDAWYVLALVAIVPVHVFAVRRYLRAAPGVYAAEREAMSERAQHLLDSLRGIDSVRAYELGERHLTRIAGASWAVARWTMRARAVQNVFFARLNVAEYAGMAGLLIVGFVLLSSGVGTIGGTTAAMLLFLRLFGPINQLLFVVDDLQSAVASLGRIVGVVGVATAVTPAEDAAHDEPGWTSAALRMRSIRYAYPNGADVLHDVSVSVAPRERVAVVGASGAGKSTLAAIAAGLSEADRGTVERPASVVLVTQEVHVFDTTLRENLTLANPGADDSAVLEALGRVGGDTLLARLPAGLDERVGVVGSTLTPAEAQQVALARVLLADPACVVLDEATAEAGSVDAGRLEAAADAVMAGRTALVVAHRLTQAAAADRVVHMSGGRVTEEGSHTELVAARGGYAELWEAWRRGR